MLVWNAYARSIDALAFSPCGRALAVGGSHLSCLLIDPATGKPLFKKVPGKQAEGLSLAFAPDGHVVCRCGPLSVRSAADGAELRRCGNWCRAFGLAADGESAFVADGGNQELVRRYDLATGDVLAQATLDVGAIRRVAASPNGKTLAVLGTRQLALLTADGLKPVAAAAHRALSNGAFALAYSPCGRVLVYTAGRTLFALNARTGRELASAELGAGARVRHFTDAAFTPDGRRLITVSKEGTARVWDTATWACERALVWDVGPLRAAAVAPDGSRAAVAGDSGRVVVWDLDV